MSQRYVCMKELMHVTLQKASDTGPSFSEAVNSCTTFSRPLLMACISSARYFNCIYIIENLAQSCQMYKELIVPKKIQKRKRHHTFVEASKLTRSFGKSRSSGSFSTSTYGLLEMNFMNKIVKKHKILYFRTSYVEFDI